MRFTVAISLLLLASSCWASTTVTNGTYASGNGDTTVSGGATTKWANYDVESVGLSVTTSNVVITLLFNYGAGSSSSNTSAYKTLTSFKDGTSPSLNVGDLFLYDPSGNSYGISLNGADGTTAGTIYAVQKNSAIQAGTLVGSSAYRPTETVWMDPTKVTAEGTGTVSINQTLQGLAPTGLSNSAVQVTITIPVSGQGSKDLKSGALGLFSGGTVGFQFESTTCANGVFASTLTTYGSDGATPEPSSIYLATGGLLLAGVWRIRRKKRAA